MKILDHAESGGGRFIGGCGVWAGWDMELVEKIQKLEKDDDDDDDRNNLRMSCPLLHHY
jgi:hypothetical protein